MICSACGAEVKKVTLQDGTEKTLDASAREFSGPDRYMVDGDGEHATLVSPLYEVYAYGDHEKTCPSAVRERERRERK